MRRPIASFLPLQQQSRRSYFILGAAALAIGLLALWGLRSCVRSIGHEPLPDFAAIADTNERKAAFFGFLRPYVEAANLEIAGERERLERLLERDPQRRFGKRDARWVHATAAKYGIELKPEEPFPTDILSQLDVRIGAIPPSLALAQAALESGWGTSRFAREGNNLFGIWCYEPGCGLVPRRREPGRTHEVAVYRSPRECFTAYIQNLNSNSAYRELWRIRAAARARGETASGYALAAGLLRYSEERELYVRKVRGVIRGNNLE